VALTIFEDVPLVQDINSLLLGEISEERAATEDGLNENHSYVDLRRIGFEDLRDALEFEETAFARLEAEHYADHLIDELDEEWEAAYILPEVDLGLGSAAAAIAALGHVPISSCRGRSSGDGHRHHNPCVLFYANTASTDMLIQIAKMIGISVSNNLDMVELYTGDIRLMKAFASCT
jgi:hypothetical protein